MQDQPCLDPGVEPLPRNDHALFQSLLSDRLPSRAVFRRGRARPCGFSSLGSVAIHFFGLGNRQLAESPLDGQEQAIQ